MKPSLFVRILCHKKIFTKAGHDRKTASRLNPLILYRIMDISYCWTYQLMVTRGIFQSLELGIQRMPLGEPDPVTVPLRGKGFDDDTGSPSSIGPIQVSGLDGGKALGHNPWMLPY